MHIEPDFKLWILLTCFLNGGFIYNSYTQPVGDQSVYQAYDALVSRENTGLFNGPQFTDTYQNSWDDSHIYLESANYQNSTLVFKNQLYTEVPMRYDLIGDNISIRSDDHLSLFKIKVDPKKISSFTIYNRNFIKLTETGLALTGNDFFEVASVGKNVSLYIKHVKKIRRETIDKVLQQRFVSENYYLLRQHETYHAIHSMKDFKKINPDKYAQVRNFHKQNRSLYKASPDDFIIELVEFLYLNQNLQIN